MIKIIDAETFFGGARPGCVPGNAPAPDREALVRRTEKLDSSRFPLKELSTILRREHIRLGAGDRALASIASIDGTTAFVVCGQQAGLFGGPLYTLYKALHAVCLARGLNGATGRNVLPLFWIASDDHDFDEVKGLGLRTPDGSRLRAEYMPRGYRDGMPVGDLMLDSGIGDALKLLDTSLGTGDRSDRYRAMIRSAWREGVRWTDAFAAQMAAMCSGYGLVLFDPRWQGIKRFFSDIIAAELSDPLTSTALVNEEAEKLEQAGLSGRGLRKPVGSTNLFLEVGGIRYPLTCDGGVFSAGTAEFNGPELLDICRDAPERFSPGAALRPVCQDAVMPVAALIGGPGERLYLGQLRPLYDRFGVDGSLVWPRASFTIIDRRVLRVSEKEQVPVGRLFDDPDRLLSELASEAFPDDIGKSFESLRTSLDREFSALATGIGKLDRTLVDSAEKEKGKVLHILEGIRGRAVKAHKATMETTGKRILSASSYLRPNGGPQERWFGADVVYTALGEEGIDELMESMSPGEERHRIVGIR